MNAPAQKSFTLPLILAGGAIAALVLLLMREFLPSMAWALLLAVTTWGMYERILAKTGGRRILAAAISAIGVSVLIGVPVAWLGTLVTGEVHRAMAFLQKANAEGLPVPAVLDSIPVVGSILKEYWAQELSAPNRILPLLMEKLSPHVTQAPLLLKTVSMHLLHFAVEFFFAVLTLFFAYIHGPAIAKQTRAICLRLMGPRSMPYFDTLPLTMRATVSGMILVAIGEGVALGTAYWITGLPSVVTLATASAVMAIVPGGAPLSFCLASLYLYGTGHTLAAIGLITWGASQLFVVDHFIRPRLIGDAAKLPFLVVLFGLLGGLTTFGLVGLFIGPTCTAAGYLMWKNLSAEQ